MGNPSQNYGVSLANWDHAMLLVTRHKRTHLALTPSRFTYPGGMEGRVDTGDLIANPRPLDRKSDAQMSLISIRRIPITCVIDGMWSSPVSAAAAADRRRQRAEMLASTHRDHHRICCCCC